MRRKAALGLISAAAVLATAGTAGASSTAVANRIAGKDRFETADKVAEATFTKATVAIVASGRSYADAMAATYLSGASAAPLYLTERTSIAASTLDSLEKLGVEGVIVVGGTGAVGDAVIAAIEARGLTVDRLDGKDRYETARAVAELLPKEAVGTFRAGPAAIVVSGEGYADAVSAGPLSASQGLPILLTPKNSLNADTKAALAALGIKQVILVGGVGAVSETVGGQINAMGITVDRIGGASRQATAKRMAELTVGELQYPATTVILVRGDAVPDAFADALSGGSRGGQILAPVLLTQDANDLGADATAFITANRATIDTIEILGGEGAVGWAGAQAVDAARLP